AFIPTSRRRSASVAQADRDQGWIDDDFPGQRYRHAVASQSEGTGDVYDEAARTARRPAAAQWEDGHGLTTHGARRDPQQARWLRPSQDIGPDLAHLQPRAPT